MERDKIGAREQFVERHLLDPQLDRAFGRQERIIGDDAHLQPLRAIGDDRADIARADQPEGLPG